MIEKIAQSGSKILGFLADETSRKRKVKENQKMIENKKLRTYACKFRPVKLSSF